MQYNAKITLHYFVMRDMIPSEVMNMPDYKKMYYTLFNAISDALMLANKGQLCEALEKLRHAQIETEEIYLKAEDR